MYRTIRATLGASLIACATTGCGGAPVDAQTAELFDDTRSDVWHVVDMADTYIGHVNTARRTIWVFDRGFARLTGTENPQVQGVGPFADRLRTLTGEDRPRINRFQLFAVTVPERSTMQLRFERDMIHLISLPPPVVPSPTCFPPACVPKVPVEKY